MTLSSHSSVPVVTLTRPIARQVVSTLLRTIDIPWPRIFVSVMSKVSLINLNLVRLPKAACLNPALSYYDEFNGTTLGLLCMLLFILAFWLFGRYLLSPFTLSGVSESERSDRRRQFRGICLQRTLMLLYFIYPGVSVAIFGVFACTQVGDQRLLDQDFRIQCDADWRRYVGGAIAWVVLVPLGIPTFFNRLLRRYRVPDMAALVEDNAWLREAAEHTWRLGMPQPATDVQKLCCDTIDDAHLAMLHAVLVKGADADRAADILAGRAPEVHAAPEAKHAGPTGKRRLLKGCAPGTSLLKLTVKKARRLSASAAAVFNPALKLKVDEDAHSRELRLAALLLWCRHGGVLSIGATSWSDDLGLPGLADKDAPQHATHRTGLRSHEVPALLKRACEDCGFLFAVYTSKCWYWESVELLRKLALTSILALVSPGSAGQVVTGCMVALFALLANIKLKPFASANMNLVNAAAQLNLFLYLQVALLLKVNLDGDNSAQFYTGVVAALMLLPMALPFALQAYLKLGAWGEQAEDMEDSAEEGDTADFEAE